MPELEGHRVADEPLDHAGEPLDEAEEAGLDALADAEIEAGKGIPHERMREWLLRLGRGEPPLRLPKK